MPLESSLSDLVNSCLPIPQFRMNIHLIAVHVPSVYVLLEKSLKLEASSPLRLIYTEEEVSCAGIFKQSMGAKNRVGIGLPYLSCYKQQENLIFLPARKAGNRFLGSLKGLQIWARYDLMYRPARLHRLANSESIPGLHKSFKIPALNFVRPWALNYRCTSLASCKSSYQSMKSKAVRYGYRPKPADTKR
jgi:hypothetical protein